MTSSRIKAILLTLEMRGVRIYRKSIKYYCGAIIFMILPEWLSYSWLAVVNVFSWEFLFVEAEDTSTYSYFLGSCFTMLTVLTIRPRTFVDFTAPTNVVASSGESVQVVFSTIRCFWSLFHSPLLRCLHIKHWNWTWKRLSFLSSRWAHPNAPVLSFKLTWA